MRIWYLVPNTIPDTQYPIPHKNVIFVTKPHANEKATFSNQGFIIFLPIFRLG